MNIGQVLFAAALSFIAKSATARIGNYQVTAADTAGAPVHLTASSIILAYEQFSVSGNGSITVGSTIITVQKLV